jgi:hypothetical protein
MRCRIGPHQRRHCEEPQKSDEAIQCGAAVLDCFVAALVVGRRFARNGIPCINGKSSNQPKIILLETAQLLLFVVFF